MSLGDGRAGIQRCRHHFHFVMMMRKQAPSFGAGGRVLYYIADVPIVCFLERACRSNRSRRLSRPAGSAATHRHVTQALLAAECLMYLCVTAGSRRCMLLTRP